MRWRAYEIYMRNLLAQRLKIPIVGKIFFACKEDSSTNHYYEWLRHDMDIPSDLISVGNTAINLAYTNATANRNDVILAMPGEYTVTSSLAWAKSNLHLIGCGGPLSRGDMTADSEVLWNCETAAVESVTDIQGYNVQFHGVHVRNVAADAGNLCGMKLSAGRSFYAEDCQISAQGAATQIATATACALWFYSATTYRPWGAKFVNCKIGDSAEIVRTAGPVIYLSGTTGYTCKFLEFDNCIIEGWTETASVPTVNFAANYCIDRWVRFRNSLFYNYYVNNAGTATEVFYNGCGTTVNVLLENSSQMGHAAWNTTGLNYFYGNQPAAGATGGLLIALT